MARTETCSLKVNVAANMAELTVTAQQKQSSGACAGWEDSPDPVDEETRPSASHSWGASRSSAVHASSTQTKKRATA